jgi:hypothetical protein
MRDLSPVKLASLRQVESADTCKSKIGQTKKVEPSNKIASKWKKLEK